MTIQYMIGTTSVSKKYSYLENINLLKKQLELSIPLITGVRIKKEENQTKIYVGKEIHLANNERYLYEKYGISLENIAEIKVLGYDRACILNFKKYDTVLVGVEKDAIVVPDYFALKNTILNYV